MASTRAPVTQDAWLAWALRVLLALGLLALLPALPVWTPLQRLEHDLLASWTASPPPDLGVLVVGLDEPSLAALNLPLPLPRRLHAQLVQALSAAGALALGIDMLFAAPQSPADDAAPTEADSIDAGGASAPADTEPAPRTHKKRRHRGGRRHKRGPRGDDAAPGGDAPAAPVTDAAPSPN